MDLVGHHGRVAIGRRHADEPGGDFAIVVPEGSGRLVCFLGDVAGHGRRVARLARDLENVVRDLARWLPPGELLGEINARVEATWAPNVFASAVCVSLDPARGAGFVAVGGQVPPVVRGLGTTSALVVSGGPPMGFLSDQSYAETPFELADGEVMVLVTDGVTDPLASELDVLGMEALLALVNDGPHDLADLCTELLKASEARGSTDDATVIAIARSTWALGHPLCSIAP